MNKKVPLELLEKIRHELVFLTGLHATDNPNIPIKGYVSLNVNDLICLDYNELIKEIDEVLE